MDFVFGHEAEPLPGGDESAIGSLAFALEVVVGEAGEDFHGFGVEAVHEGKDVVEAVGEFFAVSGVERRVVLDGFGPHVAFRSGDVTEKIAESEFAGGVGPVDLVGRNAAGNAESAFTDVGEIVKERLDGGDFHGAFILQERNERRIA